MQNQTLSLDSITSKRKFKLPKLELEPFNGEVRYWLGVGRLGPKKIYDDDDIVGEEKYKHLILDTHKRSRNLYYLAFYE